MQQAILFIADSANDCIRKVNTHRRHYDGGRQWLVRLFRRWRRGNQPVAGLSNGCCGGSRGNLFISDTWNSLIRKVDTNGIMTTVAGYVTDGYILWGLAGGDGGPATTAELRFPAAWRWMQRANLFITDTANNRVRKVDTHLVWHHYDGEPVMALRVYCRRQ